MVHDTVGRPDEVVGDDVGQLGAPAVSSCQSSFFNVARPEDTMNLAKSSGEAAARVGPGFSRPVASFALSELAGDHSGVGDIPPPHSACETKNAELVPTKDRGAML